VVAGTDKQIAGVRGEIKKLEEGIMGLEKRKTAWAGHVDAARQKEAAAKDRLAYDPRKN
jgi:hypothetical protein